MKKILLVVVILLIALTGIVWYYKTAFHKKDQVIKKDEVPNLFPTPSPDVLIYNLQVGTLVSSPLKIQGKARGSWFFEGVFPVTLKDSSGKELAKGQAKALDNWQTTDYVLFEVPLAFYPGTSTTGTLVFEKDNPSGLPQNAGSFELPVRFK